MLTKVNQRCPNCRKPITKHRPWCEKVQTTDPAYEGDIVDHPVLGPTELISVYSREEAIQDGVLIDCTEEPYDGLNRKAGIIFDVAITHAAFAYYIEGLEQFPGAHDIQTRYWDLLRLFRFAVKESKQDDNELLFDFACLPLEGGKYQMIQVKAVVAPGDRGEPCLTFMLPDEV